MYNDQPIFIPIIMIMLGIIMLVRIRKLPDEIIASVGIKKPASKAQRSVAQVRAILGGIFFLIGGIAILVGILNS